MSEPFEIIADGLAFPEGPVVMADGVVIVVELAAGRITRCWNGRTATVCEIGGGPNGAAIGPDGALYVCNNGGLDLARFCNATGPGTEGRLERVDLHTGKVERVFEASEGVPFSAPNDLVFDAAGGVWFTDLGKRYGRISEAGALYHGRPADGSIRTVQGHAVSYNGVGLSPGGETVYVADTFQSRLYAFDAATADKASQRLVATVPGMVELDSLAVTASGAVCIGTLVEGGISEVAPDGAVRRVRSFDERYVTNIAFGGDDMRDAYITLSSTGRLIRTRWSVPGLKLHFNG